jgi:hypothetical protein
MRLGYAKTQTHHKFCAIGSHVTPFEVKFEYEGVTEKRLEGEIRIASHLVDHSETKSYLILI